MPRAPLDSGSAAIGVGVPKSRLVKDGNLVSQIVGMDQIPPIQNRSCAMFDSDEIAGRIKGVLVQALNVDEDEMTSASRLQADLGAESIDMLDIVFRLEREFGL